MPIAEAVRGVEESYDLKTRLKEGGRAVGLDNRPSPAPRMRDGFSLISSLSLPLSFSIPDPLCLPLSLISSVCLLSPPAGSTAYRPPASRTQSLTPLRHPTMPPSPPRNRLPRPHRQPLPRTITTTTTTTSLPESTRKEKSIIGIRRAAGSLLSSMLHREFAKTISPSKIPILHLNNDKFSKFSVNMFNKWYTEEMFVICTDKELL